MAWPETYNVLQLDEVDSTNEEARRISKGGFDADQKPLWIIANRQSAGRGRQGRDWFSPQGNLMCSLLLPLTGAGKNPAELGFVAGLALRDMLCAVVGESAAVRLKWPNDILLDGAKIGGILLETLDAPLIAIGMGLNLAHHPTDTPYPAISLHAATRQSVAPHDALEKLAVCFDHWLSRWQADGFAAVRDAWCHHAYGLGEAIHVKLPHGDVAGVFESLNTDGQLVLRQPDDTIQHIAAGDVFFNQKEKK